MCIIFYLISLIILVWLLHIYMTGATCKLKKDLRGKVVFITGANSGIGKETAILLAEMGATIIIACRDTVKGETVLKALNRLSQGFMIKLDLSDFDSVKQCVEDFKKLQISKIDILINNAGVAATQTYKIKKQGHELQFGTNHLGHFLLTELLVPYLKNTNQARVINVSALLHERSQLNLKDINSSQYANSKLWSSYYNIQAYGQSKLCNILHTMEFSTKHQIKGCSLHPGVVRTELVREAMNNSLLHLLYTLASPIIYILTKSCVQGAQTTLHCALIDYDKLVEGGYYSDCKLKSPKHVSYDLAQRLWLLSEEKVRAYL